MNEAYNEIYYCKNLDHPSLIKILDYFQNQQEVIVVYEFFEKETMLDYLSKNPNGMNQAQFIEIIKQALLALKYIHDNNILHRALDLRSFLMNEEQFLLGNLFLPHHLKSEYKPPLLNMPHYFIPPEVYYKKPYDEKSEIWCLGTILHCLITGKFPPNNMQRMKEMKTTTNQKVNYVGILEEVKCPEKVISLIGSMISDNPDQRSSLKQLLQSPLFKFNLDGVKLQLLHHQLSKFTEYRQPPAFIVGVRRLYLNYLMPRLEKKQLVKIFQLLDSDNKNFLNEKDFVNVNIYLKSYKEDQIKKLYDNIDVNKDGSIQFQEYCLFACAYGSLQKPEILRGLFNLIVNGQKCQIDIQNYQAVCQLSNVADYDETLFNENCDQNKQITENKFVEIISRYK